MSFSSGVLWLRLSDHITFIKFCVTGLCGVVINLGSFYLMLKFGIHKFVASPAAIMISIFSNFLMNNYWTFGDRAMVGRESVRGVKFGPVSFVTLLLSYSIFVALSMLFPGSSPCCFRRAGLFPGLCLTII